MRLDRELIARRTPSTIRPALALPLLAALLLAPACGGPREEAAAPEPPAQQVRTARIGGAGDGWVEVPGAVEAAQSATLASRLSAVVEAVAVEEGAFVRAGDSLVRLGGDDIRARLEAAEANLVAALAQRDRIRSLFGRGAATRQELDLAVAAEAAARAESEVARAQLKYVDLRAPFDGYVTGKRVQKGDLASPGQPLLSIQGVGRLRVAATVSRGQAQLIRVGDPSEAVLEDGSVVRTRIAIAGPAGDPASLRFLVKCDLPAGSGARAGSFARLRLPRGPEEPAILVPEAALIERGALTGVFVAGEGRARLRWISVGEKAGDARVVRAGLTPGEEVILEPRGDLEDGAPIVIVNGAAGAAPPGAAAERGEPSTLPAPPAGAPPERRP